MNKSDNAVKPSASADYVTERHALVHPSWVTFVRFCRELGHGEIENLKIQDGFPVTAEIIRKKIRFTT
jgi:hypothetical protein